MVIEKLKGSYVFLDTAPLIYFIEGNSEYKSKLDKLFKYNDEAYFKFLTTSITILEVLVKPLKEENFKIADQYKNILLQAEGIDIFDITTKTSIKAAEIRAKYNFRTPDAIQLASAIEMKADFFLTNDHRLSQIKEMKVVLIKDLK
jgi:predicted nucleic acid-binding protein